MFLSLITPNALKIIDNGISALNLFKLTLIVLPNELSRLYNLTCNGLT